MIDPECTDFVGKPGPAGPKGDKGDPGASPTTEEIARIVVAVIAENPDQFKGKDGTDGRDGAPGKDAHFDCDKLTDDDLNQLAIKVLRRLPPFRVHGIDPRTGQLKTQPVYLDGDLDLKFLSNKPYKPES